MTTALLPAAGPTGTIGRRSITKGLLAGAVALSLPSIPRVASAAEHATSAAFRIDHAETIGVRLTAGDVFDVTIIDRESRAVLEHHRVDQAGLYRIRSPHMTVVPIDPPRTD